MLPFGQMVAEEGPVVTEGTILKFKVAALEVAAGVQVPDTKQRYWYVFMELGAEVRFMVAVVTVEYTPPLIRVFHTVPPLVLLPAIGR